MINKSDLSADKTTEYIYSNKMAIIIGFTALTLFSLELGKILQCIEKVESQQNDELLKKFYLSLCYIVKGCYTVLHIVKGFVLH